MLRRKRMRLVRSAEAGLWIFQHLFWRSTSETIGLGFGIWDSCGPPEFLEIASTLHIVTNYHASVGSYGVWCEKKTKGTLAPTFLSQLLSQLQGAFWGCIFRMRSKTGS